MASQPVHSKFRKTMKKKSERRLYPMNGSLAAEETNSQPPKLKQI